jgi:hypothetical protein
MADRTYTSLDKLFADIGEIVQAEIMKFAEEVKKALKMELKAKFYGRPGYGQNDSGTDWYTRTWELVECISVRPLKKNGNEYITEVFYDTDKMNTYDATNGEWSKHQSITTQTDVRLMIPFWIEFSQNSPLYSWGEFHIVGDLTTRLIDDRALLQHFESALRRKGFQTITS